MLKRVVAKGVAAARKELGVDPSLTDCQLEERLPPILSAYECPKPFFYLADTAWRFLYCTDKEMAERYMRTRAEQGFTVFMLIAELVDSGRD